MVRQPIEHWGRLLKQQFLPIIAVSILVIGLISSLFLSHTAQDLRQDAAGSSEITETQSYAEQVQTGNLPAAQRILELVLTYNASASPVLTIERIEEKNGYAPTYPPLDHAYTLLLLNSERQTLSETPFAIPISIEAIPPEPGKPTSAPGQNLLKSLKVPHKDFAITIPSLPAAQTVVILDPTGKQIVSKSLSMTRKQDNHPNFRTQSGTDLMNNHAHPRGGIRVRSGLMKSSLVPFTFPPHAYAASCSKNKDCGRGNPYCIGGSCRECRTPGSQTDCNASSVCGSNHKCVPLITPTPTPPGYCTSKAQCGHWQCSANNRCVECNTNQNCKDNNPNNQFCSLTNTCVQCVTNQDCNNIGMGGKICSNYKCVQPPPTPTPIPNNDEYLDIAFIGDGYGPTEQNLFYQQVNDAMAFLLSVEPYRSRASRIRVHYVNNTVDLHCHADIVTTRLPICNPDTAVHTGDDAYITSLVNNAGVPYDRIVVIWNTDIYGGSGGDIPVFTGRNYWSRQTFLHEFGGHALGKLVDEYVMEDGVPPQDSTQNCSPIHPNPAWERMAGTVQYFEGCDQRFWYRSSENSIMRSVNAPAPYFNEISRLLITKQLDYYTGPSTAIPTPTGPVPTPIPTSRVANPPDSTPPTVSITWPYAGSKVPAGKVTTIYATASDASGIDHVDFFVNNNWKCTAQSSGSAYTCNWQVPNQDGNNYSLTAIAYDTAKNAAKSVTVKVSTPNKKR